jgi:large subunit ribosomal protein L6
MSRLGKQPVIVPQNVKVLVHSGNVKIEGPKGKLALDVPSEIDVIVETGRLVVKRKDDSSSAKAKHGLIRTLLANSVSGVVSGYERKLEIVGVGFRSAVKGKILNLTLGFSHPVDFPIPEGVTVKVENNTVIVLQGADKALLGETAAKIRALRPPEPYQGKGIRYSGEHIRRKAGKAAATGK